MYQSLPHTSEALLCKSALLDVQAELYTYNVQVTKMQDSPKKKLLFPDPFLPTDDNKNTVTKQCKLNIMSHIPALVRSHMNSSLSFKATMKQAAETLVAQCRPQTITAAKIIKQ